MDAEESRGVGDTSVGLVEGAQDQLFFEVADVSRYLAGPPAVSMLQNAPRW